MEIDSFDYDMAAQYTNYSQSLNQVSKDDRCPCDDYSTSTLSSITSCDTMVMAGTFANLFSMTNAIGKTQEIRSEKELSLIKQYNSGILQERIKAKEVDPQTLINRAILENSPIVIQYLISLDIDLDLPDENKMTPMTSALLIKSSYAVGVLLANGASPNPDIKWNDAGLLELAISMRDADSAHMLIEHGADVNANTKSGQSLLTEVVLLLSISNPQDDKLINLAKEMVEKGADVNGKTKDSEGRDSPWGTPIFTAITFGNIKVVQLLVELGADVNITLNLDADSKLTPLKFAMQYQIPEIITYLVQMGAKS